MPITQSESALSAADYSDIQAETGSMSAEIIVERYGPVWDAHPDTSGSPRTMSCFDAILVGQYLLRAYFTGAIIRCGIEYMPSEISGTGDESWSSVTWNSETVNIAGGISLVENTSPASRIFYFGASDNDLYYADCANITSSAFGAGTMIADISDIPIAVAAVSPTKVYYITRNLNRNRRLYVAEYIAASWTITDSDIYWPFPVFGFDAVSVGDTDILAMSTRLSPSIGSRIVGTEIQTEVENVYGIVTFEVTNNRWSDWIPIDVIDHPPKQYDKTDARKNIRLSYTNDYILATYFRSGGHGAYEYARIGVSRSKDGRNWEFPELLPSAILSPCIILPRSDYLYAVGVNATYRSPKCAWAGQDSTEYDATPYVLEMQSQAAEIRNSSIVLANPPTSLTDIFDGTISDELCMSNDRLQIKYNVGYMLSGVPTRVLVSTEDVTSRTEQRTMPKLNAGIDTRDYLGRVNRVRSDYAAEWPSTQCGRSAYDDPTGTGYGGLRHTAPYDGSWKAEDGKLKLVSRNKDGLAISTFVTDALCGSAQVGFTLTVDDENEYAGIAFHVYDRRNLFHVSWHPDEDQFILVKRIGDDTDDPDTGYTETTLDTVDTSATGENLGWKDAITSTHYMKIVVRYNLVYLYVSDDAITWSAVSWAGTGATYAELTGVSTTLKTLEAWSGRFGVVGYGFVEDEDVAPPYVEPWTPPAPIPPSGPTGAVVMSLDQVCVSLDFFSATVPSWYDLDPDDDLADAGRFNCIAVYGQQAYLTTGNSDALEDYGLWYCADITLAETASSSWTLLKSTAQARIDTEYNAGSVLGSCFCRDDGDVGVALHNTDAVLVGNGENLPFTWHYITGGLYTRGAGQGALHIVWGGDANFWIGIGDESPRLWRQHEVGGTGYIDYGAVESSGYALQAIFNGYAIGYNGANLYDQWIVSSLQTDISGHRFGVCANDVGDYVYVDDTGGNLYQNGIMVGDADTYAGENLGGGVYGSGFGPSMRGAMPWYVPGKENMILWVRGSLSATQNYVLIMSDDNGITWVNKSGNIHGAQALAGTWSGETLPAIGNAMVRTFGEDEITDE